MSESYFREERLEVSIFLQPSSALTRPASLPDKFEDAEGACVLFSHKRPEMGSGHIEAGETNSPGIHAVTHFVEKSGREAAHATVSAGERYWNSTRGRSRLFNLGNIRLS